VHDGALVAGGELGRGEVVEVVNRPQAAAGRVGADAVLGVHDLVVAWREGVAQDGDGAQDPLPCALARPAAGKRHDAQPDRPVDRAEEPAVTAPAQGPDGHVLPGRRQGLGQRERVDHAAARLGGVGEEGDLHR
jgi:hypothetical protein